MAAVDRLAQAADMHIDRSFVDVDVRTPDAIEQLLAGKHPPRPFHQEFEQPGFGRPEIDRTAIARDPFLFAIKFDVADAEYGRNTFRIGPAQQCAYPRQQFRYREWLDDVVVGAGREPANLFTLLAARGEHDDRQLAGLRARAQPAAQFDAGKTRQHPIEDHQVGRAFLQSRISFVAACRSFNLVALGFEVIAKQHCQRLLVFDNEDARAHAKSVVHLLLPRAQRGDGRRIAFRALIGNRVSLDDIVDRLRDIGRMVAHALDVLGAEHQMDAEGDIARIFHHVGEQLAEYRRADRIDFLVATPYGHGLGDIAPTIGVEHELHLLEHEIGHVLDAADQLGRRELAVQGHHPLGDVLCQITDALEVVGETQGPDDFAQVYRHGLAPGDDEHRSFLNLALQGIDIRIGQRYTLCQRSIALCQCID